MPRLTFVPGSVAPASAAAPSDAVAPIPASPGRRPHTSHASSLRLAALAVAVVAAVSAGGCVKTVRAPLKQALPSVLGPEAAAPLCYGPAATIDVGGAAVAGTVADIDGFG